VLSENGVALVGGHSVDNAQIMFGYSVTGLIRPDEIAANIGDRPGDILLLTKPLGTGITFSAVKWGECDEATAAASQAVMLTSGRRAAECLRAHGVRAATDITGFGSWATPWAGVALEVH
jgi:selenide,water dikinase